MATSNNTSAARRAVIVDGVRTPFLRAFGAFTRMDSIALGAAAVRALLDKTGVASEKVDSLIWGGAILPGATPNVGREIVLDAGLSRRLEASTVSRACSSGFLAATLAAAMIERGEADICIAAGGDSTSNAEVTMPPSFVHKSAPVFMSGKSGVGDYLGLLARISIRRDLIPQRPSIRERSTGELMGEAAERMAKIWNVSREEQDAYAAQSHSRACAAIKSGRFAGEVIALKTPDGATVAADNIPRVDSTMEKLARLKPAFAKDGTVTAGNSSALTDGAGALLIMSEEKARALGLQPLVAFRSWAYDAVDPAGQLLIGPAISMPRALERAGMTLKDVDLVDIHEAFAAQVLCVLRAMASDSFAKDWCDRDKAAGELSPADVNVHGGSVSLGHPFGGTGIRMLITTANELKKTGKSTALLGICAAGGQSVGAVIEAV